MNKKKIFNDPIYGFIRYPHEVLYEIIDHPVFQRLRRISQQALSHYVYPGALHTRFQHALGATHLMCRAIETLRSKGIDISEEEYEAACIAILLHDAGHGPFSHALEHIIANVHHESISLALMEYLGQDLNKDFSLAISIFTGSYGRPFLHQLVSGTIDTDRMDYLTRDSYFSGVAEGIIGYDRLISMMHVHDEQLVIEEKGIHSLEKFFLARKLMYWQVYLHKTVISAESMLISMLNRARFLVQKGISIPVSDELAYFLALPDNQHLEIHKNNFLENFILLDDMDILWLMKRFGSCEDFVLRTLCQRLLQRNLFKVISLRQPDTQHLLEERRHLFEKKYQISEDESSYFFREKEECLKGYEQGTDEVSILLKSGGTTFLSQLVPGVVYPDESRFFYIYPTD
jgi:HD superfamily phosphohydrolase